MCDTLIVIWALVSNSLSAQINQYICVHFYMHVNYPVVFEDSVSDTAGCVSDSLGVRDERSARASTKPIRDALHSNTLTA